MGQKQSDQSAILDAIYRFAVDPDDYLEFTETWDAIVFGRALSGESVSLKQAAEELELHRHFGRALEVFEKARLNKQQSVQAFLERQIFASAVCSADGLIGFCNPAFIDRFGLRPGNCIDSLSDRIEPLTNGAKPHKGELTNLAGSEQIAFRHYNQDDTKSLILIEALEEEDTAQTLKRRYLVRSTQIEWSARFDLFLQRMFRLTKAETAIVEALVQGSRSNQIAETRGSTIGTVRQQIKSIMEKCGSRSQSELIAMLVNLQHLLVTRRLVEEKRQVHKSTPTQLHETCVRQIDTWGTIDYEIYGAPGGQPVAFFHSQYSSARPTAGMIEAMASANLLVFSPRKPGLGDSSIEKQGTDPEGFVRAFVHLMDSTGNSPKALVGQGMSGVAVVDFAAQTPTYQGSVLPMNTGIPFTDRSQFDHMPAVPKRVLWTVWDCPDLFYAPFAFASQSMQTNEANERAFVDDQYKDIPHDRRLIEDPFFYELARISMRDFMTTPKRSADELVYWVHDWTSKLVSAAKTVRLTFLQSEHHDFLRHEDIAEYLNDIPNTKMVLLENCAQLCVFEKPAIIAAEIAGSINRSAAQITTDNPNASKA